MPHLVFCGEQVFTADSVVRMMSSDGVDTRPFQMGSTSVESSSGNSEEKMDRKVVTATAEAQQDRICIAPILASSLLAAVKQAGLTKESIYIERSNGRYTALGKDVFLEHFVIKNKRIWHLCRDIEYVVGCSDRSLDFLYAQNQGGCTAMDYWLELCSLLHGVNGHVRIPKTEHHISRDDDTKWQVAISLVLDLESVSTSLLRNLFRAGSSGVDVGSQSHILASLAEKIFRQLSQLEPFLPLDDLGGVASMFGQPRPSAPPMMTSVVVGGEGDSHSRDSVEDRVRTGSKEGKSAFDIFSFAPSSAPSSPRVSSATATVSSDVTPKPALTAEEPRVVYRCHWESSFIVGTRGKASLVTPLGRFLAKCFVCAAEEGVSEYDLKQYIDWSSGNKRDMGDVTSSASHSSLCPSSAPSPSPSPLGDDDTGVPFEYGMKYGLNEMYTAMSNVTADMSASGTAKMNEMYTAMSNATAEMGASSASMSDMHNRLSNIRSTISDISDMVQSVKVVEQYGGLSIDSEEDINSPLHPDYSVSANYKSVCLACEYALRSLSLAAQVERGMWRRNGNSVANLVYNYNRPILSRSFRDLDIATLQLGVLWLGPEVVLRNMVKVFEVFPGVVEAEGGGEGSDTSSLEASTSTTASVGAAVSSSPGGDASDKKPKPRRRSLSDMMSGASSDDGKSDVTPEDGGGLMCGLLQLLCQLVTYLPCDLTGSRRSTGQQSEEHRESKEDDAFDPGGRDRTGTREGLNLALDRLVLHMLLGGKRNLSSLNTAKHMVGRDDAVSDIMIEESVRRLCTPHSNKEGNSKLRIDPNPAVAAALFDPEFPFLTSSDLHTAAESMKALVVTSPARFLDCYPHHAGVTKLLHESASAAFPVCQPTIAKSAIPFPHPFFEPLRWKLLSCPFFLQLLSSVAEFLVGPDSDGGVKKGDTNAKEDVTSALLPSTMGEMASRLVHLATLRLHATPSSSAPTFSGLLEVRFLSALGAMHASASDLRYTIPSGLEWVLAQHWRGGEEAQRILRAVGVDLSSPSPTLVPLHFSDKTSDTTHVGELSSQEEQQHLRAARREAAQKRCMAFIKNQVSAGSDCVYVS